DAEVDVVLVDDLLRLVVPGGVDLRVAAHREDERLGREQEWGDADVGKGRVLLEPGDELHRAGDVHRVEDGDVRGGEGRLDHRLRGAAAHRPHGHAGAAAVGGDDTVGEPRLVVARVGRQLLGTGALGVGEDVLPGDDAPGAGGRDRRQVDAQVLGELAHRGLGEHGRVGAAGAVAGPRTRCGPGR